MSAPLAIGLDIGGTNARAALVSLEGTPRILSRRTDRMRGDTSPGAVVARAAALIEDCCRDAGLEREALSGIGVGIAGQLSRDHRVVINGPNLGWREVPFAALLETRLGVGVKVHNDLSVITSGEHRYGGGEGHDDLMVVYVGTGVGCGLVLNGALYEGARAKAGEIGHSKVAGNGRRCGCGERGCLETLVGGRYLEERVGEDLNRGLAEGLRAFLSLPRGPITAPVLPSALDRAAKAGEGYAQARWEEAAASFGEVMSGCLALVNPSGWVLGGGVMEACPGLRQRLVEATQARTVAAIWEDLEVLSPTLGADAGLLGAAWLSVGGASGV